MGAGVAAADGAADGTADAAPLASRPPGAVAWLARDAGFPAGKDWGEPYDPEALEALDDERVDRQRADRAAREEAGELRFENDDRPTRSS